MRELGSSNYTSTSNDTLRGASSTGYNSKNLTDFKGQTNADYTWITIGY